jgi:hypothetical protein
MEPAALDENFSVASLTRDEGMVPQEDLNASWAIVRMK